MMFKKKDGRTIIIHSHSFSIMRAEHKLELFTLTAERDVWMNVELIVPEKDWKKFMKVIIEDYE